ncbi:MAG: CotH kinase family protein [Proteobacteria bacterium]|nr:CotH kinase family protein [Pseudomonadota bacterium]
MLRLSCPAAALFVVLLGCGGSGDGPLSPDAGPQLDSSNPVAPEPTSDYLFDLGEFHHFELEVAPDDWEWLRQNPRAELYVPATFIFEGKRYEYAAVRFKGDWNTLKACFDDMGQQTCKKLSIKVSFNEYKDQYTKNRFAGLRKLVFNSSVRDPSLMHEVMSYWIFRKMGLKAPRASHAQLTVNGEWQGVFVLVEQVDKEFIEDHWDDAEGNLYKSVWPQWEEAGHYIHALRTNEETPDVQGMLDFKSIIDRTSDQTFVSDISSKLDLSYLTRLVAVDRAVNNTDGSRRFYCYDGPDWQDPCLNNNYYWYEEPNGMFHMIPWDLDHTLFDTDRDLGRSETNADCAVIPACVFWQDPDCVPETETIGIMPTQCDPLYGYIHRATWNEYLTVLEELIKGPMSASRIPTLVSAMRDKIRDTVLSDPFGPGQAKWEEYNSWLDTVLINQRVEIEKLLSEQALLSRAGSQQH